MGCYDCLCLVCGTPPRKASEVCIDSDNKNKDSVNSEYKKLTLWREKCVFLVADGEVIHDVKEISCNGDFVKINKSDKSNNLKFSIIGKQNDKYGVFVHEDCYSYVKKKTGINLNYFHLPDNLIQSIDGSLNSKVINYGDVVKYWNQEFEDWTAYENKNDYVLFSPLLKSNKADKNKKRINKIISQLKLKKDRKGPLVSATFYSKIKGPIYKLGMDKNIWEYKKGKWVKADFKVAIKKFNYNNKTSKFYAQQKMVAEYNNKPLFYKIVLDENIKSTTNKLNYETIVYGKKSLVDNIK